MLSLLQIRDSRFGIMLFPEDFSCDSRMEAEAIDFLPGKLVIYFSHAEVLYCIIQYGTFPAFNMPEVGIGYTFSHISNRISKQLILQPLHQYIFFLR